MAKAWRFVRRWWWAFVVGAATLAFLVWRLVRNPPPEGHEDSVPQFLDAVKDQAERVRLEAEIEKARARAAADADLEEIDRIEKLSREDPREARRHMASWLSRNL